MAIQTIRERTPYGELASVAGKAVGGAAKDYVTDKRIEKYTQDLDVDDTESIKTTIKNTPAHLRPLIRKEIKAQRGLTQDIAADERKQQTFEQEKQQRELNLQESKRIAEERTFQAAKLREEGFRNIVEKQYEGTPQGKELLIDLAEDGKDLPPEARLRKYERSADEYTTDIDTLRNSLDKGFFRNKLIGHKESDLYAASKMAQKIVAKTKRPDRLRRDLASSDIKPDNLEAILTPNLQSVNKSLDKVALLLIPKTKQYSPEKAMSIIVKHLNNGASINHIFTYLTSSGVNNEEAIALLKNAASISKLTVDQRSQIANIEKQRKAQLDTIFRLR